MVASDELSFRISVYRENDDDDAHFSFIQTVNGDETDRMDDVTIADDEDPQLIVRWSIGREEVKVTLQATRALTDA